MCEVCAKNVSLVIGLVKVREVFWKSSGKSVVFQYVLRTYSWIQRVFVPITSQASRKINLSVHSWLFGRLLSSCQIVYFLTFCYSLPHTTCLICLVFVIFFLPFLIVLLSQLWAKQVLGLWHEARSNPITGKHPHMPDSVRFTHTVIHTGTQIRYIFAILYKE